MNQKSQINKSIIVKLFELLMTKFKELTYVYPESHDLTYTWLLLQYSSNNTHRNVSRV